MDSIRYQLKTMDRQLSLYLKIRDSLKANLRTLIDQSYPGINDLFDLRTNEVVIQKWVNFVSRFWHLDHVIGIPQNTFVDQYKSWCKQYNYYFSDKKAAAIYEDAQGRAAMLPQKAETEFMIRQAVGQFNNISKTTDLTLAKMDRLASRLPEYPVVMAMEGVDASLGPRLMAEIGDVTRFPNTEALITYAGVEPGASQSRARSAKDSSSSKDDTTELRKILYNIMTVLLKTKPAGDPVFQFMEKKLSDGKPYYTCTTAGASKFLRIYYGRVKEYLAV